MLAFANRPELMKQYTTSISMSAFKDLTWCWLHSYSFYCICIKMSTWLTTFVPKTKQSHRASRIDGHCELEKRLTLFSALVRQPNRDFGSNLAREYPQWVFADFASQDLPHQESEWCQAGIIEHFEKMACFHGNHCWHRKIQKMTYLSTYSSYFHNISIWTYVLEDDRSNGVMTLRFQGQLIAKIKIHLKKTRLHWK